MRTVKGEIVLPPDAPSVKAGGIIVEVRDVSLADAPSTVVAERRLDNISLKPKGRIKFQLPVPEVSADRTLSMRVHVSLDGSGVTKSGDLLSTAYHTIPGTGKPAPLEIPISVI
jgi:putative lipoprotein